MSMIGQARVIVRRLANRRPEGGLGRHESFFESRDAITRFLFPEDKPAAVDLCFVLGCLTPSNMDPAIELYEKRYTQKRNIPESALLVECKATHTLENFIFSKPIIDAEFGWEKIRRVALVTKPFHMRRAVMTARAQWPDHVELISDPDDMYALGVVRHLRGRHERARRIPGERRIGVSQEVSYTILPRHVSSPREASLFSRSIPQPTSPTQTSSLPVMRFRPATPRWLRPIVADSR